MKEDFLDPAEVKKQKESAEDLERTTKLRLSDMRKILSLPEGRRYVWEELKRSGVFTLSFSPNASQTAYNEGQRSLGISLLADVELAKPGSFHQMFSEEMSKKNSGKVKENKDE